METTEICKKIFDFVLPYSEQTSAPISYINLEVGFSVKNSENELWETFNKLRWDTKLASAELFVLKKNYTGTEKDTSIRVVSLSLFEDDGKSSPYITIRDGVIL